MKNVLLLVMVSLGLGGCFFGGGEIKSTCDEPEAYQAEVEGKRIEVPDDLDPLDPFKEMPVPDAQSEPRAEGAPCITAPPAIRT